LISLSEAEKMAIIGVWGGFHGYRLDAYKASVQGDLLACWEAAAIGVRANRHSSVVGKEGV
jgi:hypothetical protein